MAVILLSSMASFSEPELLDEAKKVLQRNDRKQWTVPASDLYPHQWLWDSCFIAIGLSHLDINRAQTELTSLLNAQWANGMLPHIIFSPAHSRRERELWRSQLSPYSPREIYTSGLTQPPMLAEAVVRIGKKLKIHERRSWYRQVLPHLLRYHGWLYAERDPHQEGLIVLLHPYESGLDNSPPWISEMRKHSLPWWIVLIEKIGADNLINHFRRDTRFVPPGERMSNIEALAYWNALLRLRRKAYNSEAVLSRSLFALEDLAFNCILIRANSHLEDIAATAGKALPQELLAHMQKSREALNQLWDDMSGQYFSRSFVSHKLIEEPTVATLLPLYAGCISKERAAHLVELMRRPRVFRPNWPIPSVPVNSAHFDPVKYWQGPTWINMNWLIIDGLLRCGFKPEADKLKVKTLQLLAKSGMNEYFSPLDGSPAGAANFSWSAALAIDLIKS